MSHPLDPDATRLAATIQFAKTEGGPLIVMPESVLASWNGMAGDYERVVAGFNLIDVGTAKALTLESPDNSTFVPRPDGARIVRWIGADDAETLLTAALAVTDDKLTEAVGDFPHPGGNLVMFDSGSAGAEVERDRIASIELPEGNYAVRMCIEWRGRVTGTDDKPHDVMVQVLDLRLRS